MQKGFGIAFGTDTAATALRALQRAIEQNPRPDIAFLYSSVKYDQQLLFSTIKSELGGVPIFGTTSPMVITNLGVGRHWVIILLLSSNDIEFTVLAGKCSENPGEIAKYLGSKYLYDHPMDQNTPVACLLTGSEHHGRGFEYISGLNEVFPFPLPISGGETVGHFPGTDISSLHAGVQYCGELAGENYLSLLFVRILNKESIGFGFSYENSWQPISHPVICTKAKGNKVWEVDNTPIYTYLQSYLGDDYFQHLFYVRPKFSFITHIRDGERQKSFLRVPLRFDKEESCVHFWPVENLEGTEIQLVQLCRNDLLCGTTFAAQRALQALRGRKPEVVFVFSCTVRSLLLHSKADEEINNIRAVFGDGVPIIGMYANAELAPLLESYEDITNPRNALSGSRQLGCSVSVFALGSQEPQGPEVNYHELLSRFRREDEDNLPGQVEERAAYLERMLKEAEDMISQTEHVLRYVNNEHFKANLELKKTVGALAEASRKSEKLQEVIRQYTPHDVWKKASVSVMAGLYQIPDEELFAAFVFMDVKGFTSFAEVHTPSEVINELNKIMEPATKMIYRNRGDVDKYIGDCIFAMFKSPRDAVVFAVQMQQLMKELKTQGCPFSVRIGVNYGRVISGNVGADMRRENALIGDAVNLAQRLESNCPTGSILISAAVMTQLGNHLAGKISGKPAKIKVKGKDLEVDVFEISEEYWPHLLR
jgi:class 3 adenylate cyclase